MSLFTIVIAIVFVVAALYVRHHYGGAALAALAAAVTVVTSLVAAGGMLELTRAMGTERAGGIAIAMIVLIEIGSLFGAALMVQLSKKPGGPWLAAQPFAFGIAGYFVGRTLAFMLMAAVAVVGLVGMEK